jgi:non-ribosomal peptide synthetase-like protein
VQSHHTKSDWHFTTKDDREAMLGWGLRLAGLNSILIPIYATIYTPTLMRLLRAKIGNHAEVSTVLHISPDLIEIGEGSFLADACVVGGQRGHNDLIELKLNRIGTRSFVGNSALVPGGIDVGNDCLIGVQSTPPAATSCMPDGTRWLGSPGFELPSAQGFTCFKAEETYQATPALYRARGMIDAMRILLPLQLIAASMIGFVGLTILAWIHMPLWATLKSVPLASMLLTWAAIMMAALQRSEFRSRHVHAQRTIKHPVDLPVRCSLPRPRSRRSPRATGLQQ